MKKIKGTGYILDHQQKHIYTFNHNRVYHYSFPKLKLLGTYKSLSNISQLSLSYDEKQLAVTNTSGTIAVHSVETGEMIGKRRMERI